MSFHMLKNAMPSKHSIQSLAENPGVFYKSRAQCSWPLLLVRDTMVVSVVACLWIFKHFVILLVIQVLNSLLGIGRIRSCLSQMHQKDVTPDEKQELDEALQREVYPWIENPLIPIMGRP